MIHWSVWPWYCPSIPSIEKVIVVPHVGSQTTTPEKTIWYEDFIAQGSEPEIKFEQFPFDHPIYIVFLVRHHRQTQVRRAPCRRHL